MCIILYTYTYIYKHADTQTHISKTQTHISKTQTHIRNNVHSHKQSNTQICVINWVVVGQGGGARGKGGGHREGVGGGIEKAGGRGRGLMAC